MGMPETGISVVRPPVESVSQPSFPEKPCPPLVRLRRKERVNGRSLLRSKGSSGQRDLVQQKFPQRMTHTAPLPLPVLRATLRQPTPKNYFNSTWNMSRLLKKKNEKILKLKGSLKQQPANIISKSTSSPSSLFSKQSAMAPTLGLQTITLSPSKLTQLKKIF